VLTPLLDALVAFRESVRTAARADERAKVLQFCDAFRDRVLPELGIRVEDKEGVSGGNQRSRLGGDGGFVMRARECMGSMLGGGFWV
jgi:hypothetical protein